MNKFAMSIAIVKYTAFLGLASALIGCGGSKTVITADDSAEYRNAMSLPPLKKPAKPVVISSVVTAEIESPSLSSQASGASDELADDSEQPSVQGSTIAATSSRVIELNGDIARLQIDADLDSAWHYLSENLKSSDITVHARNKTAGRFAIGCASLQAKPTKPVKRGGWSFFSKKERPTEHCSLLLASSKTATQVKLLNRSGAEYTSSDSKALFARLLNN